MIARRRGAHHAREIWQPRPTAGVGPAPVAAVSETAVSAEPSPRPGADMAEIAREAAAGAVAELAAAVASNVASARAARRRRSRLRTTALTLAIAVGLFAVSASPGTTTGARNGGVLPATTPRQWVDAYEAAAVDNPHRVCTELLSPQLAAAYATAVHGSCSGYFARIRSTSLHVRRVLQDGGAAVVELHQTIEKTDWDVVLDRRGSGWRAVDLVLGRSLR